MDNETNLNARVGQQIRARRKRAGLSQTHIARAAGVTFQQIQKYESGQSQIPASRLWVIAQALGVMAGVLIEQAARME